MSNLKAMPTYFAKAWCWYWNYTEWPTWLHLLSAVLLTFCFIYFGFLGWITAPWWLTAIVGVSAVQLWYLAIEGRSK